MGTLTWEIEYVSDKDREEIGDKPIIASVSGGRDSTAMALHLIEQGFGPQTTFVFADTGWEDPQLYTYLDELQGIIGPVERVRFDYTGRDGIRHTGGFKDLVRWKGVFPTGRKRFCTEMLKTRPIVDFIDRFQGEHGLVVNAVGIRALESSARAKMPRWQYPGDASLPGHLKTMKTLTVWHPIIQWADDQIQAIHDRYGVELNPLYHQGASRVGCHPCIYAGKAEIMRVAKNDPARIKEIDEFEEEMFQQARAKHLTSPTQEALETSKEKTLQRIGKLVKKWEQSISPEWGQEIAQAALELDALEKLLAAEDFLDPPEPLHGPMHGNKIPTFFQYWRGRKFDPTANWTIYEAVKWAATDRGGTPQDQTLYDLGFQKPGCAQFGHCSAYGLLFDFPTEEEEAAEKERLKQEILDLTIEGGTS